jgi:hypothetical protein
MHTIQPFENGGVGIGAELVAIDFGIRISGQHLVVARVGERHAVGDARHAALGLIAEDLSLLGNHAPQERKQCFAPFGNIVAPELASEFIRVSPDAAVLLMHESWIGAGEDFLPAQSVTDDQDDIAGFEWMHGKLRGGRCDRQYEKKIRGSNCEKRWLEFVHNSPVCGMVLCNAALSPGNALQKEKRARTPVLHFVTEGTS